MHAHMRTHGLLWMQLAPDWLLLLLLLLRPMQAMGGTVREVLRWRQQLTA
jgi:hypothetical protein